jgi:hypothetical protein
VALVALVDLEHPTGVSASSDARWPRDESFAPFDAEVVAGMVLVLGASPARFATMSARGSRHGP